MGISYDIFGCPIFRHTHLNLNWWWQSMRPWKSHAGARNSLRYDDRNEDVNDPTCRCEPPCSRSTCMRSQCRRWPSACGMLDDGRRMLEVNDSPTAFFEAAPVLEAHVHRNLFESLHRPVAHMNHCCCYHHPCVEILAGAPSADAWLQVPDGANNDGEAARSQQIMMPRVAISLRTLLAFHIASSSLCFRSLCCLRIPPDLDNHSDQLRLDPRILHCRGNHFRMVDLHWSPRSRDWPPGWKV
eukprot:s1908_g8.t1